MLTVLLQNTVGFELNDARRIGILLVGIDYPRRRNGSPSPRRWSESVQRPLRRV
jgi:hypothetical protein